MSASRAWLASLLVLSVVLWGGCLDDGTPGATGDGGEPDVGDVSDAADAAPPDTAPTDTSGDAAPPEPSCTDYLRVKDCQQAVCTWVTAGCAPPDDPELTLPPTICLASPGCADGETCPDGATCTRVWLDPCAGKPCGACGADDWICLPDP